MAVIQNIINTVFNTSGDRDAENAANRLGRAQTRLGQSSAAAGREFAAQSQGLGGLVGAYAGAAATTFALGAAFDALARSARALQTLEGLSAIAAGSAQSGDALLQSITNITKGQLTLTEAAQQVNLSLSAGFDTSQIEGLADVAVRASRALGRDLTDAMTRVTRGSAKMETELLDELGIYTKIDPATRAYAAALDKSVSSLSEYERRQAFVNSVIEEGQRKYQDINVVIPTAAEKIEALGVTLANLATKLGGFIAEVVAPLADAITNNVVASFATLGLVLGLVGSKAVEVFTAGVNRLSEKAINAGLNAENFGRKLLGISAQAQAATAAIAGLNAATIKLGDADKQQLKSLQEKADARKLSQSELKKSEALVNKSIANTQREIASQNALRDNYKNTLNAAGTNLQDRRDAFEQNKQTLRQLQQQGASASQLTQAQNNLRSSQGALGAATRAFNAAQAQNIAGLNAARSASLNLNADLAILRNTLISVQGASRATGAGLLGFAAAAGAAGGRAIGSLGKIASGFASVAASAFFWISILQLLGTTIANILGKGDEYNAFFSEIGKSIKALVTNNDVREYRKTLTGLVGSSLTDIENVNKRLKGVENFTFRKKSVLGVTIEITKTKEDIVKEATAIIEEASQPIQKSFSDSITSGAALGFAGVGAIIGSFASPLGTAIGAAIGAGIGAGYDYIFSGDEAQALIDSYGVDIERKFASQLVGIPEEARKVAVLALAKIQDTYKDISLIDPDARLAKEVSELVVLDTLKTAPYIDAITSIRKATSASFAEIKENFDFTNVERAIQGSSFRLTESLANIGKGVEFTFLTKEAENAIAAIDLSGVVDKEGLTRSLQKYYTETGTNITANTIPSLIRVLSERLFREPELANRVLTEGFNKIPASVYKNFIGVQGVFDDALAAQSALEQTSLQLSNTISSTNQEFANGSIDVERYGQNIGSLETALRRSIGEIATAEAELNNLRATPNVQTDEAKASIALLETLVSQRKTLIALAREELELLKDKQPILEAQQKISKFLESIGSKTKSALDIELQLDTAQFGDELIAQELALKRIITATNDYATAFDDVKEGLSTLSSGLANKVLASPIESLPLLVDNLDNMDGVTAKAANGILTIKETMQDASGSISLAIVDLNNFNSATIKGNSYNDEAKEKLKNLGYEQLSKKITQATEDLEALNKLIKQTNQDIQTLRQEDAIAALEFSIDLSNINKQISEAINEGAIEKLELQADLVGAKVDSGELTAVQGAIQETLIQQQILDKRSELLQDEKANIEDNRKAQQELLRLETTFAFQTAAREAQNKREEIQAAKDNAKNLIEIYRANIAQEKEVNGNLIGNFTTAGNDLSQALAETLESGASALNSAIVLGLSKISGDDFAVTAGGFGTNLSTIAEDRFTDVVDSVNSTANRADAAVNRELAAVVKSIQNNFVRQSILINKEAKLASTKVSNDINALDLEKTIENANAISRIFDAIDSNISDAASQAGKDIETLYDIVKDAKADIRELADKELIASLEFELDKAKLSQELEIAKEQIAIKQLELQVQLVQAKVGSKSLGAVEGAKQENALQQQILDKRTAILERELAAIDENLGKQIDILRQQEQIDIEASRRESQLVLDQIKAAEDNANNLIKIFETNLSGQKDVNQSFISGIIKSANQFSIAVKETLQSGAAALNLAIVRGLQEDLSTPKVAAGIADPIKLDDAKTTFTDVASAVKTAATAAREAETRAQKDREAAITTATNRAIELENDRAAIAKANKQAEITNQTTLGEIETENAKKRLADAQDSGGKSAAEKAADAMKEKLNAIFDGIASSINTAITDFGNLLLYGPGEGETFGDKFRSIFSNLFKSIQQTLFQETIAKPASNFITEKILRISKTGIENAKFDERGNLKVTVANWLAASVPGLKGSPKGDKEGATVDKIFDAVTGEDGIFGGIEKLFSSIFGEGGFFSNLITSITTLFSGGAEGGGVLSAIITGIASIFGFASASGGPVHRAGGGGIPNVNTRDRVRALLEPGEFVIRKPMARQIGTPALQQLNATGQMSSGNIQVNVTNEGAPKDAQVSTPRFDGEKYVIDIVTRDLANNGPIRRSLRGDR